MLFLIPTKPTSPESSYMDDNNNDNNNNYSKESKQIAILPKANPHPPKLILKLFFLIQSKQKKLKR